MNRMNATRGTPAVCTREQPFTSGPQRSSSMTQLAAGLPVEPTRFSAHALPGRSGARRPDCVPVCNSDDALRDGPTRATARSFRDLPDVRSDGFNGGDEFSTDGLAKRGTTPWRD